MTTQQFHERVLVVDEEAEILDLITRQILKPLGYAVASARNAEGALQQALEFEPDLIIASLTLPGLSGKDLLVSLRSQGIESPVLVTASKGMEADAIQAFRLGARDYLVKPFRETEVVTAVEHALDENRLRKERQYLAARLAHSSHQHDKRIRELTTLFGIGKVVTSTTNQQQLFSNLVEESVSIADADMGWILLRDDMRDALVLRTQYEMPASVANLMHKPWNDGLSPIVMKSGVALNLHGEGLSPFQIGEFAGAALVTPIKLYREAAGTIGVAREAGAPFLEREDIMLAAIADYISISLVNARLFQALASRAQKLESVLEERRMGGQLQASWFEDHGKRLDELHQQLVKLCSEVQDSQLQVELMDIAGILGDLKEDAGKAQVETSPLAKPIETKPE
jgi:two-component system NtrC family sensor kinase